MKTLLIIQGYAKAQDRIVRHWPWYLKADCDILGVDRLDGRVKWPRERLIGVCQSGLDSYVSGANLLNLLIDCFSFGLERPDYSDFCVIENDAIFTKALPWHIGGLVTCLGGYRTPGFRGSKFFHCPWHADRETATQIVDYGRRMIAADLVERGFPDRWLGLMVDLFGLTQKQGPFWSVNDITPQLVQDARRAIADGVVFLHGIKTEEQLRAVTT